MKITEIIETPIGNFKIVTKNNKIYTAKFTKKEITDSKKKPTIFCDKIKKYFYQPDIFKGFSDISQYQSGTEFQNKVWKAISEIPYGETRTYGQIAIQIGKPTAVRAVANACGKNKIAIFVPCHRVVGKNNKGGYKWNIKRKKWLLKHEQ
ncbi:putative methylated-DNA-protein-cysteine methyltransferase [Powai lake megavirus]|uniref:methylated-DNA--[protein]-cysteine S-methyltransferase n=1 Tax=Powai lake megavirus TaxID=1842663 RepID=A0A167R6J9_9VIRU|nr:putative methylated-DNA-protein-cysteine methyltransferase [Powai lake megavirus]ANB50366.1 putative methylated-DNA-protein-cysteine methyltransferase [Powai lake megavirus]